MQISKEIAISRIYTYVKNELYNSMNFISLALKKYSTFRRIMTYLLGIKMGLMDKSLESLT